VKELDLRHVTRCDRKRCDPIIPGIAGSPIEQFTIEVQQIAGVTLKFGCDRSPIDVAERSKKRRASARLSG
jgi:hypothetical protein